MNIDKEPTWVIVVLGLCDILIKAWPIWFALLIGLWLDGRLP